MGRRDKQIQKNTERLSQGTVLRLARQEQHYSLTAMADKLGYSKGYISGVENGSIRAPERLIRDYELELKLEPGSLDSAASENAAGNGKQQFWFVPFRRNPFFVGREDALANMQQKLSTSTHLPRVLAIAGLGGIGKTQLALEYAYRYSDDYRGVLWLQLDTGGDFAASLTELMNYLKQAENEAHDQRKLLTLFHTWLEEHPGCLLVFDNVEDVERLVPMLTLLEDTDVSIILTMRRKALGMFAQTFELREMDEKDSISLLLRRAKIEEVTEIARAYAQEIVRTLGYLPLALNQAGAYIEQTGCGLAGYIHLLNTQFMKALQAKDQFSTDYSRSVMTTLTLSLEKIKEVDPVASRLLYLLAFLHPDSIYESFIIKGAEALNAEQAAIVNEDTLQRAISNLFRYSLIRTDPINGVISIHRLTQIVVRAALSHQEQLHWVTSTIKVAALAFPSLKSETSAEEASLIREQWALCQQYDAQAQTCLQLIDKWQVQLPESASLLNKVARYQQERFNLDLAETCYLRAQEIDTQLYGEKSKQVALDLTFLALNYEKSGAYEQAEVLYERAYAIQSELPDIASESFFILGNYLRYYKHTKKAEQHSEIERLRQRIKELQISLPHKMIKRSIINDTDPQIHYIEQEKYWEIQEDFQAEDYHNDAHLTKAPGAQFEYSFSGVGIDIISNPQYTGKIRILLDKKYIQEINTILIENQLAQTIIFSKTDLKPGRHTLKVELLEGRFLLDALAVYSVEEDED